MVRIPTVAFVSFNHLSNAKHVDELSRKDLDVRPPTTRERTIDPNNLASLDADSNLASCARSFVLVTAPLLAERMGLVDSEVGSINSDQAGLAAIVGKSVLPSHPAEQQQKGVRQHQLKLHKEKQTRDAADNATRTTIGERPETATSIFRTHFRHVLRVVPTLELDTHSLPQTLRKWRAHSRCFGFPLLGRVPLRSSFRHRSTQVLGATPKSERKACSCSPMPGRKVEFTTLPAMRRKV